MTKITIEQLFEVINDKIKSQDDNSYSFLLFKEGVSKISRKIGEEATEVIIAAFENEAQKSEKTRKELVGEVCDLFYHNLVLLSQQGIDFDEILEELTKRNAKKK